jgi:hypothetical protein
MLVALVVIAGAVAAAVSATVIVRGGGTAVYVAFATFTVLEGART